MKIACPRCDFNPSPRMLWQCRPGCGHKWHTFATHGICPRCSKMWHDTKCPHCKLWSPIDDWYHEDVPEQLVSLQEPHKGMILQSQTQEELDVLLPSILDKVFKGKL